MKLIFIFFCCIAICSCRLNLGERPPEVQSPAPVAPSATPEPKQEPKTSVETQVVLPNMTKDWSSILISALKVQMPKLDKAKDIAKFCPNYAKLDASGRLIAWAHLTAGMLKYESGVDKGLLKTCTAFKEPTGQMSIGFFQLSYGNKFCPKSKAEADLCDVRVNVACGTKLMGHFVEKDLVLAEGGYVKSGAPAPKGLSRYWAVVRVPDPRPWVNASGKTVQSNHKLKEIRAVAMMAPGCST